MHIHMCDVRYVYVERDRDRERRPRRPRSSKEVWEEEENYKFGLKKYTSGVRIWENKDDLKGAFMLHW